MLHRKIFKMDSNSSVGNNTDSVPSETEAFNSQPGKKKQQTLGINV